MSAQLDLLQSEEELAILAVHTLKNQMDTLRRKLFAEIDELKKENEFLSIQIQMIIEEKDAIHIR